LWSLALVAGWAQRWRASIARNFSAEGNRQSRIKRIRMAKPHITSELADAAITEVDKILSDEVEGVTG
jgi:hypothetical protein